jgi:hypothetical protein
MRIPWYVVALVMIVGPRIAGAQYNVPSQARSDELKSLEIASEDPDRPRRKGRSLGWELGASLDFMTSDPTPASTDPDLATRKLKFTDVALFRVHGLLALGRRAELFTGVDLLPKQPSYSDELVWQSALLGARYRFCAPWSAYVRAQRGPGLGRDGYWLIGEAAAQLRRELAEKMLFWESALGGTYTQLLPDEPADPLWQVELLAQSGIALREKKGIFATWLAFTFHFPLASDRALDPQTRVGLSFGTVLGVSKSVDIFVELSVLDRGDPDDPRTRLPILGGGFDQNRIVFGFNRRFGARRR